MSIFWYFLFADATGLHVTVVNATVVNISWANETFYTNNSNSVVQQNTSSYIIRFRYYTYSILFALFILLELLIYEYINLYHIVIFAVFCFQITYLLKNTYGKTYGYYHFQF